MDKLWVLARNTYDFSCVWPKSWVVTMSTMTTISDNLTKQS